MGRMAGFMNWCQCHTKLFKVVISCLAGLRKSQRQMSGMQTLVRQTDISKSLDKFPVVYDHNPREVGHNST